jgi:murein DD-endopeptidase MepM/ murein hydrolase activator NlpD
MRRFLDERIGGDRPAIGRWLKWALGIAALLGCCTLGWHLIDSPSHGPVQQHTAQIHRIDSPIWHEAELNDSFLPPDALDPAEADFDPEDEDPDDTLQENTDDPLHIIGKLKKNQTLTTALKLRGLPPERTQAMLAAMSGVFDFRRSRPGDKFEAHLDLDGNVLDFRYQTSPEDIYIARLNGTQYLAEKVILPRHMHIAIVEGQITTTLYHALSALGERPDLARRFMDLFVYDFDFATLSRQGDRFRMLVEKIYIDNKFHHYGKILLAEYSSPDRSIEVVYHDRNTADDLPGEYYDSEGHSVRRLFTKTSVKGARMTSGFTMKRLHPVYKVYRPHLGTDFAAPTGTPVMAIADGVITFMGWKGGNGNLVVLKHDYGYETFYAHLSAFKRGLKVGDVVSQKDIIAYVGSTGASTGPHLHLAVKKDGSFIDLLSIDTTRGEALKGAALSRFQKEHTSLKSLLNAQTPLPPPLDLNAADADPKKKTPAKPK